MTQTTPWPSHRFDTGIVYDPTSGRILYLTGDHPDSIYMNSLWSYDSTANAWQLRTTTGTTIRICPGNSSNHPGDRHPFKQIAYDTRRGRLYLYGGSCMGDPFTDTWYYSSATNAWTQVFPATNPGSRFEGAMAYDPVNDLVVLYGGLADGPVSDETWHYSPANNTWQLVSTTGNPGPRGAHTMIYDSVRQRIVLFGGYETYPEPARDDIWVYDAATRTWMDPNPSVRPPVTDTDPPIAFDARRRVVVYYAGVGNTWAYNVATNVWQNLSLAGGPPNYISGGSQKQVLSYDAGTDAFIAVNHGGCNTCDPETWQLRLGPPDPNPPTVSITAPASGATVVGTVTVATDASANTLGVQFRLDGANLGAEVTTRPYSISWGTNTANNGPHTLGAVARNAAGSTAAAAPVTVTVANPNPLPTTTSLSLDSAIQGNPAFALTVNGSNFVAGSVVRWNGADRATTFVSSAQLTTAIPTTDIATAGTASVTAFNPAPGGGTSNAQTFTINNPLPTMTGLNPAGATTGGPSFTLTVNGTGFVNGSVARWNGANRATTFVSPTQLMAAIFSSDIATVGTASVTVFNPVPGGGLSNAQTFTISATLNPLPTTTGLVPSSTTAGGPAFTLTVNGTGFAASSVVRWNGGNRTTTFVSSTQLAAAIPATDIAAGGTPEVTVFNPAPGGGLSNAQTLTINNPVPTTTSLSPTSATSGGAGFILTMNGTGFVTGSGVRWNGADRATTFVSSTQLTVIIPASDIAAAGTASVTVFNATPGGGTSNAQILLINNPVPFATSLDPPGAVAGRPAFTLTVSGGSFVSGSVVRWNGASRTTTFVSSTQLAAAIAATDIAVAGAASVAVFNPAPGGGSSNAQSFTISGLTSRAGLVAAYGFNEGSGTTLADASGNGNNGTISGATWTTAGRFGNALVFNGANAMITVPDANSLDLTTAMTLEAWVYSTADVLSGWRVVIMKEQPGGLVYFLDANNASTDQPSAGALIGGEVDVFGGSQLATNSWTHLAATYDGTMLRLYVNGAQVASRAQTGMIQTSASPLRIGGNSIFGEFFAGRIDEVRIYSRALSQTEIQSDMVMPVGP